MILPRPVIAVLFAAVAAVAAPAGLLAQNRADSLRRFYDFAQAVEVAEAGLAEAEDSLARADWEVSLLLARNGLSMIEYSYEPVVVAKHAFSVEDFFLYYPMEKNSWRLSPNVLDPGEGDGFIRATFVKDYEDEIYFSRPDSTGRYSIYETHYIEQDTLWSSPVPVFGPDTDASNEIYPLLSVDGHTLYFASDGLYGMGGYDIYYSEWDDEAEAWGTPENMGFPFSSPYDDFLFFNTEDGRYTIFASNRETPRDSVCIYVLEYDSTPVRRSIDDLGELRILSSLTPPANAAQIDNRSTVSSSIEDNADIRRYAAQVSLVKAYRDTLYRFHDQVDLAAIRAKLDEAVRAMQKLEMEFLFSGRSFDMSQLQRDAQREIVGASSGYTFSKNALGPEMEFRFGAPEAAAAAGAEAQPRPVRRGRALRAQQLTQYYITVYPLSGRALPSAVIEAIQERTTRDIVRIADGDVHFRIGAFSDRAEAERLLGAIRAAGEPNCSLIEEKK